ncbi:type II secretion system protein GspM [Rhodoferax sp.]|uniref:type II secretion system protein GspM n=1 Tax=Rhodoferax sp. TaxID=50421 RepID=UPI00261252A7|nr:type II secretion system protein GspM [Rhodoferax sp.]MDD2924318.1 type II secretion system protein GspM [Rhodoferax sp.]
MNGLTPLKARWQAASRREQRSLILALVVVALALLWWLALAPALAVWRSADSQRVALEAQLQQMLGLQAQARALQALPTLNAPEARRALEEALKPLGTGAQMTQQMDRLNVTLKGVPAQALAQWLSACRQNAHLVPVETHLRRAAAGAAVWDGSVVFALPAS